MVASLWQEPGDRVGPSSAVNTTTVSSKANKVRNKIEGKRIGFLTHYRERTCDSWKGETSTKTHSEKKAADIYKISIHTESSECASRLPDQTDTVISISYREQVPGRKSNFMNISNSKEQAFPIILYCLYVQNYANFSPNLWKWSCMKENKILKGGLQSPLKPLQTVPFFSYFLFYL